ncbi:hypothetical protein L1987_80931 [Smallanthus sonchifolius]|uniref:Uncharacterized protein n=1 Tax=Smallanthus sonchifolius TaxID=185202 RepID=A0ACB8YPP1_9ASTR|nr:hypothetical protein L1987_80931 [Smallanthus sonchifolius]
MDIVTPIITPVVESLLVPVKRHLDFLVSSSNKVEDMHVKMAELDGAARDIHTKQVSSKVNRRVIPHRVPDWLAERKNELVKNSHEREVSTMSKEDISKMGDNMSIVAFSSYQITHNFHNLRKIKFESFQGVEVVFEIESQSNTKLVTTHQQQQPLLLLPYLEDLDLASMDMLSHVWKCNNWNEFFILHKNQPHSSLFQNLTTIRLESCNNIKYLFSPLMVKLLSNLKEVRIKHCNGMEEVVSNADKEITTSTSAQTTTTLFPLLDILELSYMDNLKHIGGGIAKCTTNFSQSNVAYWSLCQYPREINIFGCNALSTVIPYYAAGHMQKLQMLSIKDCSSVTEAFESKEFNNNNICGCSSSTPVPIPRPTYSTMHKLPHLKILTIVNCQRLENIFTFSTFESLKKLEMLTIRDCKAMKVVVKEEYGDHTTVSSKDVVFPPLKSLELAGLPNLQGFFLGMNIDFQWSLLDYVMISDCPQMTEFTSGRSTTPRLKYIHTELGEHNLECGLNFHDTPTLHQHWT